MFSMPLWPELGAVSHGYKKKERKMTLDVLMEPVSVPRTLRFYKELRTVHELRKQIQKVLVHQDVGEPPSFVTF